MEMSENYWGKVVVAGVLILLSWVGLEYDEKVLMVLIGVAFVFPIISALIPNCLLKWTLRKVQSRYSLSEREQRLFTQVPHKLEQSKLMGYAPRFKERKK